MAIIQNPFLKRPITRGLSVHKRVLYLKSLRKLNTTRKTIPNPSGKGRKILVFGHSHINYLYNNFSLNQQNEIIEKYKRILEDAKQMEDKDRELTKNFETWKDNMQIIFKKIEHSIFLKKAAVVNEEVVTGKMQMMKKTSQMLKRNKKEQEKKEEEKLEGPKFSCLAIFCEQIKDDDKQKYRKIIVDK